ncbi:LysR substrate-binding domain-containing protein [Aliiroseovarius sp. 2305UL8-7]|uniref:LysR substrate-binding domain-containing protein n=1 Tax=Aliiroseovarius conchicola TaxID=3121637 RepID=UPI0035272254
MKPTPHLFTNDAQALHRLAQAGAGLAIVPEFLVAPGIESGAMDYVLPSWELRPISVYAEWPANAPKHGLIHLALDALSQAKP